LTWYRRRGSYAPGTVAPTGCLAGDLNEDGAADLLVTYWGRTPVAFLSSAGGVPTQNGYVPVEVVPEGGIWNTGTATFADVDGDGHVDIVVGNYFRDGDRVLDPAASGRITMQDSMSRAANGGTNRILLWRSASSGPQPSVEFVEAEGALPADIAGAWTLAVGAADLDDDLLPELYFANDFGPDRLMHNRSTPGRVALVEVRGRRDLTIPRSRVLGRDSYKGMGIDFGDLNGDGHLDITVSNIASPYALLESHYAFLNTGDAEAWVRGRAPFRDQSEALGLSRSGWAWESRIADMDADGTPEVMQATGFIEGTTNRWPELQELATGNDALLANPAHWPRFQKGDDLSGDSRTAFFVRGPGGRYADIGAEVGLEKRGVGRGLATGDVDGDGDLDLVQANQWATSVLYRNDSPVVNRSLLLDLQLPILSPSPSRSGATRPAIGAQVRVTLPDGRVMVGQVDGGNGHSGKRSTEVHFGLGPQSPGEAVAVAIRWRDPAGTVRELETRFVPGRHRVVLDHEGSEP
jgi:enediyne biosynthesis protein E4